MSLHGIFVYSLHLLIYLIVCLCPMDAWTFLAYFFVIIEYCFIYFIVLSAGSCATTTYFHHCGFSLSLPSFLFLSHPFPSLPSFFHPSPLLPSPLLPFPSLLFFNYLLNFWHYKMFQAPLLYFLTQT